MGPIVIYYHVNGREFNWTRKDCLQMKTVGYNGLNRGGFLTIINQKCYLKLAHNRLIFAAANM